MALRFYLFPDQTLLRLTCGPHAIGCLPASIKKLFIFFLSKQKNLQNSKPFADFPHAGQYFSMNQNPQKQKKHISSKNCRVQTSPPLQVKASRWGESVKTPHFKAPFMYADPRASAASAAASLKRAATKRAERCRRDNGRRRRRWRAHRAPPSRLLAVCFPGKHKLTLLSAESSQRLSALFETRAWF